MDQTPPGHKPGLTRVLIVEDNPGDLWLTKRMLASDGTEFRLTHASTLSSALEQLSHRADVVLLDLDLPESQGLDTLRRIREHDSSVPIIILTGMDDRDQAVEALNNGAQEYLIKSQVDGRLLVRAVLRQENPPRSK